MKVLVTGSEGFLGKHICAALKNRGHDVVGLDSAPGAEIVADITKVMPIMKVDAVIHLAAVASPSVCVANPDLAFNVNVLGTHQTLRLALESGAKKFVFSSSAHVYDIPPKYMPTDECHPLRLNNIYTTTKLLGEQLCHLFWENHGLSYTTLRLFNAYGPGQGKGYFIPDQLGKARHGEIELLGGTTTKDWVYVDDVARAFVLAVESGFVGAINIGTGLETPLSHIAQTIGTAFRVPVTHISSPNTTRMQADCRRAWQVLGWKPTTTIEEGLDVIINHAQDQPVPAEPPGPRRH